MHDLGRMLVAVGIVTTLVGALLWRTGGLGPLGRLPGDIVIQRGSGTFAFPIVTCVVISVLLSLIGWVVRR
jgi:hypothetical protein